MSGETCDRLCGEIDQLIAERDQLKADLQRHKSCLEVARGALRECVQWAEDHFAGSSCKFEQPAQLALHQINEVLGGDSTKTT